MFLGLDFGTTNSALARLTDDDGVDLLRFTPPATRREPTPASLSTYRSVLWFSPDEKGPDRRPLVSAGVQAIHDYLDAGGAGRFVQSVKSHLASKTFTSTMIDNAKFSLEDMIALIVAGVRREATRQWGTLPGQIVAGRPVHFVRDDVDETVDHRDDDAFAEDRLRLALSAGGFTDVVFELEPVAAAARYEHRIRRDELVLIADFGGGTTDLCLVEVGPTARAKAQREGTRQVIATGGLGVAGDTLDRRILHHAVAPRLGWGSRYRVLGGMADVPLWLFTSLSRWHTLSFLKSRKTTTLLDEMVATADDRDAIIALRRLIADDLGYLLHRAVEKAKVELSLHDEAVLSLPELDLEVPIARADFEGWIEDDVEKIDAAVAAVLEKAGRPRVDRVFLTGGTALVPAVRRAFATRFGAERLEGGEELVSVAQGLALRARGAFSAP